MRKYYQMVMTLSHLPLSREQQIWIDNRLGTDDKIHRKRGRAETRGDSRRSKLFTHLADAIL